MRYRYLSYKYTRRLQPDAAFQNVWESFGAWTQPGMVWRPPTDVFETPDELIIVMELAGVDEEHLTVSLFSDLLVVEGRREQTVHTEMNACHQLGIKYGDFRSEIHIPFTVDTIDVNAQYRNGLLTIILKKSG